MITHRADALAFNHNLFDTSPPLYIYEFGRHPNSPREPLFYGVHRLAFVFGHLLVCVYEKYGVTAPSSVTAAFPYSKCVNFIYFTLFKRYIFVFLFLVSQNEIRYSLHPKICFLEGKQRHIRNLLTRTNRYHG